MRRSRNCKATFKGTIVTFPLILSASLSPPAAILPLVNKKAQLRGGGIGNHRPEGGIFGQLHCHRREEYHRGYASLLFRASAANLPPSGAQRPFQSHLFWRKAGGRRQGGGPLPRPVNAAPGRMGPKGTDVFLCHRPFMLAFFDRLKRLILNNQAFVIYGVKGFCSIKLLQATL